MNRVLIKSYCRSIQRGTRTLEDVPEKLRDEVRAALETEK